MGMMTRFEYDALDRQVAVVDGRGNCTAVAYDAKGNLVSVTDASATQSLHYAYSPYGTSSRLPSSTLSLDNSFQFSSEYHDTSLALTYYNYRHYNYEQGRWMSRDPIEVGPVCYVFRNPILNRDYLGLSEDAACANFCSSKEAEELWLRAFVWNQEEGTMAVPMGLTLCCKGKVQVCDFTDKAISAGLSVEGVNLAEKTVRDAISFCTLKHEIYHASEAKCDKCETGFAQPRAAAKSRPDLPGGALFDECAAYTTEINCLINRRKYDCTTMSCRKSLTNFIENKRKQRAKACSPEYIDPRDLEEDLERKYQLME